MLRSGDLRGVKFGKFWCVPREVLRYREAEALSEPTPTDAGAKNAETDALLNKTGQAARNVGYHTDEDIERLISEVRAELGHDAPRRTLARQPQPEYSRHSKRLVTSRKERPLIVLNTNVLISAAISPKPSAARDVILLWKRGFLQLVLSDEMIHEYLLVLSRFNLTDAQMRHWATWFVHPSKIIHLVEPKIVKASRNPKDDPFLDAALTGHADWIISRDEDLLVLEKFEGIPIITPNTFMDKRVASEKVKNARKKTAPDS